MSAKCKNTSILSYSNSSGSNTIERLNLRDRPFTNSESSKTGV